MERHQPDRLPGAQGFGAGLIFFGTAIVAVALQSLLSHGATGAFQGAFWWAVGIATAAVIPAIALPAKKQAGSQPAQKQVLRAGTGLVVSGGQGGRDG